MKGINVFMADGFEDMEALATLDVLRRAGLEAQLVSYNRDSYMQSSHGLIVQVDADFSMLDTTSETTEKDVMIFPGGMPGSKSLAGCRELIEMMQAHYDAGGTVAAICAAPGLVLSQLKGIEGATVTCFDGFEGYLTQKGAKFEPRPAITSGRIITGRSAGHAIAFAFEILKKVAPAKVDEVRQALFLTTI